MNTSPIKSNTGDAEIKRKGQTADGADGAIPDATIVGRDKEPRDLNP